MSEVRQRQITELCHAALERRASDRAAFLRETCAGDEALRTFAISIFANIRTIDKLGRYGGEEFLLVMPDTTIDQAVRTLDRLRLIIAELGWAAISKDMQLTMSAGVCAARQDASADDILARADRALYRAKDAGRNRVVAG